MQLFVKNKFSEAYLVYKDILFHEPENLKYQMFANQIKTHISFFYLYFRI